MRRWKWTLAVVALATSSLWADQIFVRNRPFKGLVEGKGAATTVDLKAMAECLQLKFHEVQGGYVLDRSEADPDPSLVVAGQVLVEGKSLACQVAPTGVMVNLYELVAAAGGKVVENKSLGTLDIYLTSTPSSLSKSTAGDVPAGTHTYKRFKLTGIQGIPLPDGWIPEGTQRAAEAAGSRVIDALLSQNPGRLKAALPGQDAQRLLKELGPGSLRECEIFWQSENACGVKATFNPGHGKPPGYNFLPLNTVEFQLSRGDAGFRAERAQVNLSDCPICKKRAYGI